MGRGNWLRVGVYEPSVQVKTVEKPQERTWASESLREEGTMAGGNGNGGCSVSPKISRRIYWCARRTVVKTKK